MLSNPSEQLALYVFYTYWCRKKEGFLGRRASVSSVKILALLLLDGQHCSWGIDTILFLLQKHFTVHSYEYQQWLTEVIRDNFLLCSPRENYKDLRHWFCHYFSNLQTSAQFPGLKIKGQVMSLNFSKCLTNEQEDNLEQHVHKSEQNLPMCRRARIYLWIACNTSSQCPFSRSV